MEASPPGRQRQGETPLAAQTLVNFRGPMGSATGDKSSATATVTHATVEKQ